MTDPAASKQLLREKLRFRRRHFAAHLDPMARFAAFRVLPDPLAGLIGGHDVVAAYVAHGDEPDILPMLGARDSLALPFHAGRTDAMEFRRWDRHGELEPGPWTTRQPADDGQTVVPSLLFCPLVGFDRSGGRLGQGGGHYDRWFAANPDALRIGVGWSVQEVDKLTLEATDMPLDAILTEQEVIMTGNRL